MVYRSPKTSRCLLEDCFPGTGLTVAGSLGGGWGGWLCKYVAWVSCRQLSLLRVGTGRIPQAPRKVLAELGEGSLGPREPSIPSLGECFSAKSSSNGGHRDPSLFASFSQEVSCGEISAGDHDFKWL